MEIVDGDATSHTCSQSLGPGVDVEVDVDVDGAPELSKIFV